jgi:mRNA interferase MazF
VVAASAFVPDRGDVVWLAFTPQAGREQAGRRPAVVLTPRRYNDKVGLAICCPITSQVKGYPFEVALPAGLPASGVILADQVKILDWRSRRATLIARLPDDALSDLLRKLGALLQIPEE